MNESTAYKTGFFFGKRLYVLIAALLAIPFWLAANAYAKALRLSEDETVATGLTITFFAGAFAGRYIAQLWMLRTHSGQRGVIATLAIIIAVFSGWLLFYADFPLRDRVGLSLLVTWLPFIIISLSAGMLVKTIKSLAEKQLREARSSAAHNESELRMLQSQLSPHFLFNTLNNMYGLSITQHDKIPPLLLKLSDLLRYSVYRSNEMFVPLNDEIEYINNYIEFEKIRLSSRLMLETDIEVPLADNIKIAPMLLIVFIENAFKHSRNTPDEKVYIEIGLKTWNNLILFSVKNTYNKEEKNGSGFDKNSGFGLDNVIKRLELLYPGEYTLEIEEQDNLYTVMLQVKIKK